MQWQSKEMATLKLGAKLAHRQKKSNTPFNLEST